MTATTLRVRVALTALLAATAVLYLWGLDASGWANAYYSAAAQAASQSWKAWFFGSLDAANAITVDKTPASLWITGLSVKLFGANAWSILVPQALEGVAAVGLLYATVRRWFAPGAALLSAAVFALTPVAVLMFRFNNPDALLVLLLVAAAYATVRAVERASTWWLVLAGALVGFGFLTKMLQALLVVPALALVYLVAAPTGAWRRIGQLAAAGLAIVLAAGWWIAVVELWPAASRPYIGGSQTNSVLELALGYNGIGRLTGEQVGSVGGGRGWGETGWTRLLDAENGGQAGWLLPAALVLLVAGLVAAGRAPRTDRTRAALLLWGTWLLVTAGVFSFMAGIFHAYYTVALAPAVAALVGVGAAVLYERRHRPAAALTLAGTVAGTAIWAYVLLGRSADWQPWLRPAVLTGGLLAAAALAAASLAGSVPGGSSPGGAAPGGSSPGGSSPGGAARRLVPVAAAGAAVVAVLAAPLGYSLYTAGTAHAGAIPTAGPVVAGTMGPDGRRAGPDGAAGPGLTGPGGATRPGPGGFTRGGPPVGAPGVGRPGVGGPGRGGLLNAATPSAELVAALTANSDSYRWVAAAVGANNAAGYQLATGKPVVAIGGFNGSDPAPTLAQFQRYVAEKRIHYFIGSGGIGMRQDGGSAASREITEWVAANFTPITVGGETLYDLTA